jgi:hypothetical protein
METTGVLEYKKKEVATLCEEKSNNPMKYDVPKISDHEDFLQKKYTIPCLKFICGEFKLKKTGKKLELIDRIHNYLRKSFSILLLQKNARRYLVSKYSKFVKLLMECKSTCKNDTDFFTLEQLSEIPNDHFFAFKEHNNVWGFNIISIYNLFVKTSAKEILNPYTREKIDPAVFHSIKSYVKLSSIVGKKINLNLINEEEKVSFKKQNENKSLELFQRINELGHYSLNTWFLNLSRSELICFVRELMDIWEYRAELSRATKCQICFPTGNPFHYNIRILYNSNYYQLQQKVLLIISEFITKGISDEFSNLGVSYVLCALTIVSPPAAEAMPWFYNSVL